MDYFTAALLDHMGNYGLATQEGPFEVCIDNLIPLLLCDLGKYMVRKHRSACIVDQHIDSTKAFYDQIHHEIDFLAFTDL